MSANFRILDKRDKNGRASYASLGTIYNIVDRMVGDKLHNNGIPIAIEVEGWAELASYDDVWENEDIVVICEEAE